jgi:hypothetical protein
MLQFIGKVFLTAIILALLFFLVSLPTPLCIIGIAILYVLVN